MIPANLQLQMELRNMVEAHGVLAVLDALAAATHDKAEACYATDQGWDRGRAYVTASVTIETAAARIRSEVGCDLGEEE